MKITAPYGYDEIVPLRKTHRVLMPAGSTPAFCRALNALAITGAEFTAAARDYPIVFASLDRARSFAPVVVLGLAEGGAAGAVGAAGAAARRLRGGPRPHRVGVRGARAAAAVRAVLDARGRRRPCRDQARGHVPRRRGEAARPQAGEPQGAGGEGLHGKDLRPPALARELRAPGGAQGASSRRR